MVRQVALVPAGCQPWNLDVVASQQNRFAYSASLAIYIYEIDKVYNDYKLLSIMSEHKKTITSISWCPDKPNLLASAGTDGSVIIWDVVKQNTIAKIVHRDPVMSLAWCHDGRSCLGFIGKKGPLFLWHFESGKNLSLVKESQNFSSVVMMFRWHHGKHNRLAFGHEDGSVSTMEIDSENRIGSKSFKHILKPEHESDEVEGDPVMALEWDPLSMDYLLVCNQVLGMRLVDIPKQETIMRFELPSAASRIQSMSWVHTAPGMFVTGDYKSGILRVWSASNSTPIENIKIKNVGFHRLEVISIESSHRSDQTSSSLSKSASKFSKSKFSLPNSQVVCTFVDGGVGLYDLGHKKWTFLREQGHVETIFDCKFHPDNRDHLATASFDGTVKVWDITSMTCLQSSPGNQGIIYHISWAPADLECIVAGTSREGAFIWDIKKGKIIRRLNNHAAKTSVYCVAWNQVDPRLIMSAGADGYCVIQQADGKAVHRYKHPAAVFGCAWSPFNKDMLATGCEDKTLRVYYTTSTSDQPIKQFTGHDAKVFSVRWNPLKEGVLCSGSDDGTIRVWDYTKDQCTCVLKGHTAQVRGLSWNSEISTVLVSGSWDSTIRIWDTQSGACLFTIEDHGADVYGLTSHPSRPFLLASSSRDSTVRLWTITSLFQSIKLNILLGKSEDIASGGDYSMSQSAPSKLSGKTSKTLTDKYLQNGRNYCKALEEFSKFFTHPCGTNNLWDLVSVISGKDSLMLSSAYKFGIVHKSHITQFKWSEAQQLQMVKMSKFGEGIGAPTKDERLLEAANIYIKLGKVEQYCELMVEIGEWERALAIAPAVSMDYWHNLNERYCSLLLHVDNELAIPFCVASGAKSELVKFLTSRGQLSDATVVAQSASEGMIRQPRTKAGKKTRERTEGEDSDGLVHEVMNNLSAFHFRRGSPILSACCHLAINDLNGAMSKLIRSNELDLAFSIGQVLCKTSREMDIVIELLAKRCENLGRWDLGLDFLSMHQEPRLEQAKLCMRCSCSLAEVDALHIKAGLPSMDLCAQKGRQYEDSDNISECIKYYLLSVYSERGLEKGLAFLRVTMNSRDWKVADVLPVLQLLGCMKTEKLQHSKNTRSMYEVLTLSAYIGALVAIRRQYNPIVVPLFQHARALLKKEEMDLPLSDDQIEKECELWQRYSSRGITTEKDYEMESLLSRCGSEGDWDLESGPECVASSHLPSHSDIHKSILTGQRIQGPCYILEDGKSAISQNEALMWAKVNPFSPIGSGVRINPF